MMSRLSFAAVLVLFVAAFGVAPAEAACTVSAGGINFGGYDVFSGSHDDATGIVSWSCTKKNEAVTITINTRESGTISPRRMGGPGGDNLDYNIYTDASRTTIWGDSTGGTGYYFNAGVPKNTTVNVTAYARIFSGQDISGGSYSDTVTVTIFF